MTAPTAEAVGLSRECEDMADHLDVLDAREEVRGMEEVGDLLRKAARALSAVPDDGFSALPASPSAPTGDAEGAVVGDLIDALHRAKPVQQGSALLLVHRDWTRKAVEILRAHQAPATPAGSE